MTIYQATAQLRWVRRLVDSKPSGPVRELILQQWWADVSPDRQSPGGEWRDVPVEDERGRAAQ